MSNDKQQMAGLIKSEWKLISHSHQIAEHFSACIKDKGVELFAVNILKALKSKHLK